MEDFDPEQKVLVLILVITEKWKKMEKKEKHTQIGLHLVSAK